MANGEVCCILGVCCPPAAAQKKLAEMLAKVGGVDQATATKQAAYVFEAFDLAPAGTLGALKAEIARHAKTSNGHA